MAHLQRFLYDKNQNHIATGRTPEGFTEVPGYQSWLNYFQNINPGSFVKITEEMSLKWIKSTMEAARKDAENIERGLRHFKFCETVGGSSITSSGSAFNIVSILTPQKSVFQQFGVNWLYSVPVIENPPAPDKQPRLSSLLRRISCPNNFTYERRLPNSNRLDFYDLCMFDSLVFMRTGLWKPASEGQMMAACMKLSEFRQGCALFTLFNHVCINHLTSKTMVNPDELGKTIEIQLEMLESYLYVDHVILFFVLPFWNGEIR
uniref:NR LBD domain-containing protein n=1 Tax=Caenorhabditis tropicalis TaxID=1561998 RepID=A0A1I7TJ42_9PELO